MEYELIPHEDFVSSVKTPGEALTPTQKLIRHLRGVYKSRNLTVPQISKMINDVVSSATLYRFFEEDSELHYNFQTYTIDVIRTALLVDDTLGYGDAVALEKTAGFLAIIEQQHDEYAAKCRKFEEQLEWWQNQIRKKDERMDRKDEMIAEKDRIIREKDEEIRQLRAERDEFLKRLGEKG